MAKRIIAGILGGMAAFASLLPLGYTYEVFRDLQDPAVPVWSTVLAGLFFSLMALTGFVIGFRFLRFAFGCRSERTSGWGRPLLLGAGFFFPGFVFSLPLAMLVAQRMWPGDDRKVDLAMEVSLCVGVAAAVICSVVLFRKWRIQHST
jgi:hypothetical protein